MVATRRIGWADPVIEGPSSEQNPMGEVQPGDMIGNPHTVIEPVLVQEKEKENGTLTLDDGSLFRHVEAVRLGRSL
jgi:hypothetical protein